jgi:hypothetical protein
MKTFLAAYVTGLPLPCSTEWQKLQFVRKHYKYISAVAAVHTGKEEMIQKV